MSPPDYRPDAVTPLLVPDRRTAGPAPGLSFLGAHGVVSRLAVPVQRADAAEAVARSTQVSAPIDLLLTDVVLPKVNGSELAEELRRTRPELPVLYTSGFTDNMIEQYGALAPGISFLARPYTPSALSLKVRQVLESALRARERT